MDLQGYNLPGERRITQYIPGYPLTLQSHQLKEKSDPEASRTGRLGRKQASRPQESQGTGSTLLGLEVHTLIPALGRHRKEEHPVKVSLSYIAKLKPAWAT